MAMYDTPQFYRWVDPRYPGMPALSVHFQEESQINAEFTKSTGIQTYDSVLIAYVAPMGMPKSNAAHEIRRRLPDGTIQTNTANAYKYAEQLKHYDAGNNAEVLGTPLRDLVGMSPATALNLKSRGIHTIEMLADMPDSAGHDLMGFWELRDKAKKHLELREKEAPMVKVAAELAERDKTIASLERRLQELTALVGDQAEKRGPGRPRKAESEAA